MEIVTIVVKILFIVFFFGFCIFIHEFGHLLVAMWRGLHIEKFSVGFGRAIYKWRKNDIDYQIGWLPFGGFVALPQLDPSEDPKTSDGEPLPQAKPSDRILTAFAGPLFNIIFGFFLACFIWQIGIEGPAPAKSFIVGHIPETYVNENGVAKPNPEYTAGLRVGDIVVAVNGESFERGWQEALEKIVYSSNGTVRLSITRGGEPQIVEYNLVSNPDYEGLGYPFMSPRLPTRVGGVMPDSPAMKSGLQEGDILLEINGEEVINSELLIKRIQEAGSTPVSLKIRRAKNSLLISKIVPELKSVDGESRFLIGIQIETAPAARVLYYPTPLKQFNDVISRTYKTFRGLFDQKNPIKAKHMSGPVGIFHMLYVIVSNAGFIAALNLIILITFSLAIINLFPLPILDGGHIAIALIELIIRRRIPPKITLALSYMFAALLISFMLYVTFYDAKRVKKSIYPSASPEPVTAPASGDSHQIEGSKNSLPTDPDAND